MGESSANHARNPRPAKWIVRVSLVLATIAMIELIIAACVGWRKDDGGAFLWLLPLGWGLMYGFVWFCVYRAVSIERAGLAPKRLGPRWTNWPFGDGVDRILARWSRIAPSVMLLVFPVGMVYIATGVWWAMAAASPISG